MQSTIIALALLIGGCLCKADPCQVGQHFEVDQPKRSIAYVTPDEDTPTCDQHRVNTNAWYRFNSYTGSIMPEQCVPIKRCGTYGTIWMNGSHPTVPDGEVNKMVCANYGRGDCCEWSATIKVKKCPESFFVYKLADPEACYVGYCVGNETVCPAGEVLVTTGESKQCVAEYPRMTSIQLAAPVIDNQTTVTLKDNIAVGGTGDETIEVAHFSFECIIEVSIENGVAPENVGFEVVMTFDGNVDARQASLTTTAANPRVVFGEEYLYGHLGTLVACRARAYRIQYRNNRHYWSPSMTSNTFWAGIRRRQNDDESITWNVDPLNAILEVKLVSTIPVTFWHLVSNPEKQLHKYTAGIPSKSALGKPCELEITETNNPGVKVELTETSTDGTMHFDIEFNAFKTGNITSLFGGYKMTNIQITVVQQRRFMGCSSYEEPHIKPFNGSEYTMTTHVGDFYLWKDERPNILFEVQARIYLCNDGGESWQGTCNCGVAVREGNDVIVMDFCNRTDAIPVFTLEDKSGSARPIVRHDGEFTNIVMPSGNRLTINAIQGDMKRLNIYLEIPEVAVTNEPWGLCNELNSSRSHLYRVNSTRSLFDTRRSIECKNLSGMPLRACSCSNGELTCSGLDPVVTIGRICANTSRSRRSAELSNERIQSDDYISPDELYYEFKYDNSTRMLPLTWPTRQGRTLINVRKICENKLQESAVLNSCRDFVDIDNLIKSCITDIQITDDLSLADSKLDVLENLCGLAVTRSTYVTPDDDPKWPVPPGYMTVSESQQLTQDICPSRCSNRGTCHSRKCSCLAGFGGADCSVNTTRGPTLVRLQTNDLCDVRTRECHKTRVVVENVMHSDNITCKWDIPQNVQHISRGRFLSRGLLSCDHAFSSVLSHGDNVTVTPTTNQTLTLTLSNDGALVSNALHLTIYDSLCVTCFSNHTCTPRITACTIGGRCYKHFHTNPDAPCLHCDVTKNSTTWSVADELQPQVFTLNNTVWIYENEEIVEKMKVSEWLSAPAQFSLNRPNLGITLSVDGVLRFTPGHLRNQTIELSAVDQCGRRVEIQTTVVALTCPCHNEAPCSKENHFTYKPWDLLCLCTSGYHGNLCEEVEETVTDITTTPLVTTNIHTEPSDLTESAVTDITATPIISTNIHTEPSDLTETLSDEPGRHPTTHLPSDHLAAWSEWGSWGDCSDERCLRYRHRLCVGRAATGCQGHYSDVFRCRDCVAHELTNEKDEGIIIVIGQGSEKEALVNLHKVPAFLVESVNVYCTEHGEECCSLVSAKRTSSLPLIMTSEDYIHLAQGSPKMLPNYQISFKWVVNVWTSKATETCQESRRHKRDTRSRDNYLPAALIYNAVKDKATVLEQLLGVDLIGIRQPAKQTETTKQDSLPLILSIVAVVLAILLSCCIVYAYKAKCSRKQHKTAAYASSDDSTYAYPVAKETTGDSRNVYTTLQSQSPIAFPSLTNGKDEHDYATIDNFLAAHQRGVPSNPPLISVPPRCHRMPQSPE